MAEFIRARDMPDEFAGDIAGIEVGENQHVGSAGYFIVRQLARGDLGDQGGIDLQFAIEVGFDVFLAGLVFG